MTISDLATLVIALGTVGSLLYISRQVNVTRQQTKGQFLLALDAQFEKNNDVMRRLINEKGFTPVGDEWPDVWKLMSVFERINIMVEDNILDIGLVDRLWGFLLLKIVANEAIYDRVAASGTEWQDFIDLCHAIAEQRRSTGAAERTQAIIDKIDKLNKQSSTVKNPFGF